MTRLRVLVTGGSGQLGRELVRQAPAGFEVSAPPRAALDLARPATVREAIAAARPAWVINAAAYTAVDKAEADAAAAYAVNRDGAGAVAAAARECGARLLHVSTDFVFDGGKSTPYLPADAPNPLGVYGASKLAGEQAVRAATGGEAAVVRTAWVYAAHGANFVRTILRLLAEKPELRVVSDQVGTPTSAASLARTLWRLVEAGLEPGVTLHCTDAGVGSWYDLAVAIRELAPPPGRAWPPILPIRTADYPTPARRPAYSVLDKTDTWRRVGPAPLWREALAPVVAQLLAPSP